ncbi:zinc ribbon domain-containing protein [Shewanella sp. SW36]|uniref:zinc ribbon domain-containing protein n=1 Tax=unclassified Shewanella TaxID=196818 RepID=UPI0021D986B3|nr:MULTISPECIES: zinc ribbon domain-containing protein [unclassified Shewanella]MCU7976441.1 zinc ribbon domain-containing protein [Shewanella sp. SW36]MCU7991681.1 zinc ribbon domain-containing protein [Shewanella sp. SW1]MCU8053061.1 zinc ribbon domain-containing protein [Shewanella sp. SM43]
MIKGINPMLICDKCSAGINEGAKFCPQCGDPVTDADRVIVPITDSHIANVDIKFGESSSIHFGKAIDICKNIPTYSISGEGKQAQHKITLPITEVELIINLFELVGSWKSSQLLINGHAATKKDLIYHGVGCYRNRQKAYKPAQFCFGDKEYEANIWGCKRLNMPINEWGGGWLDYGEFDGAGVWHFDKKRIRHELELILKDNELCPALNYGQVIETINKLPDSINPKVDSNWQYRTSFEEVNGDYKEVAVGIKPIIKKINRYVIGEFKPSWESEDAKSNSGRDHVINVSIEHDGTFAKKVKSPKKSRSSAMWWIIGIVVFIVFLFK